MRILVDARHLSSLQPAGVGGYTESLLHALFNIDQKNEYVLLSTGSHKPALKQTPENVSHLHIYTPNKLLNLRTIFLKHPTINWRVREPVDLIFLPNLNITSLPEDIPTVLTMHDLSWHIYPEFYSKKMQLWHKLTQPENLINKSRSIITPSESTKRDLEHFFKTPSEKVQVVPHGVGDQFDAHIKASDHGVRSRLKLPKRFVFFVGTIEPRKNILALIEGVKRYREQTRDNLHLVIAGSWGWKSHPVRRRLWKRDVSNWVHTLGYVESKDLPAIYRSAIATMFPSIYEGFGLPVLESLASGTPVITSHTSSMPEVAGNAALYIDPYNSNDITEALRGLLNSNALQKQLRDRGIERARQYSWESSARQTINIFEQTKNT